jgi:hypothetical protein
MILIDQRQNDCGTRVSHDIAGSAGLPYSLDIEAEA